MAIPGVFTQVSYGETGTTLTDIDGALAVLGNVQDQSERLDTARGTSVVTRILQQISVTFQQWSQFTALNTLMQAGTNIDLEFTASDGTVFLYSDLEFTVSPVLFELPSVKEVYIAAAGAGSGTGGTSLGALREDAVSVQFSPGGPNNKLGQQVYAATSIQLELEFFDNVLSALATYDQSTRCELTFEDAAGNLTVIDDLGVDPARVNLRSGAQELVGFVGSFNNTLADVTDKITVPASPADYEFRAVVNATASGSAVSDFLTIT